MQQRVVELADLLDQLHPGRVGLVGEVGGNLDGGILAAHLPVFEDQGLHLDQVDHAAVVFL